ncbi:gamma-glutamyltransferase [Streptomyces sp. NPDC006798]|uniref:gamma-glutamyltransferase n=1 Tax=Streptomyces sp. NPDC006798 TaxID=3155462 RepID=UPI0033CE6B3A
MPVTNSSTHQQPRYLDAVDVPVLFRAGPGGRTRQQWRRTDHAEWPGTGFPATDGWYLPTTTWREILKAAVSVGRDFTPWLDKPEYAVREIAARISPLGAYLDLHPAPVLHTHGAGRRLTANIVLEKSEASAFGAFSYRLGMTFAEWACRSLMGLGETWDVESGWPQDITDPAQGKKAKGQKNPRPDLWGTHTAEDRYWLVEAKGGTLTPDRLDHGWEQVQGGCSVLHPYGVDHRAVLCGANIRRGVNAKNDVFVIIRHEHHPGTPPAGPGTGPETPDSPDGDGQPTDPDPGTPDSPNDGPQSPEDVLDADTSGSSLLAVARSQMLPYLALRSLRQSAPSRLRLVPVARNRAERRRTTGRLTLMEDDHATRERRDGLRRTATREDTTVREAGLESFLTGRIPGTEITLGMSGRLYSACHELFRADREIAERTPGLRAEDRAARTALDEDDLDQQSRMVRREYRERQEEARPRLQRQLRTAYLRDRELPWSHRMATPPEFTLDPAALEATTPETYLAIRPADLPRQ